MQLSIIIVNYNVKNFLEQCLRSVQEAAFGMDVEVFVVDNHSVDHSVEMVKSKFPFVRLIENKENLGFSKANNQAVRDATGAYILFLNPDTVLEKDTLRACVDFMDSTTDAGAVGVKMVDGKGHFLPESKRCLPTPSVAFYKIFGFATLFPKSKRFGQYNLSYLDKDSVHAVDVLAGAFMMVRHAIIDTIGSFDEQFFMYGEDIDLSYRITQAGYKNYYLPFTKIIHYKGESTKKGSLNYVVVFYKAMALFYEKHFSKNASLTLHWVIQFAIILRAMFSIVSRFVQRFGYTFLDGALIYAVFRLEEHYWAIYAHGNATHFGTLYQTVVMPIYVVLWILGLTLCGAYSKHHKLRNALLGIGSSTLMILVGFALGGDTLHFSRALILIGAATSLAIYSTRELLLRLITGQFKHGEPPHYGIVAQQSEYERLRDLLIAKQPSTKTFWITPDLIANLDEVLHINQLNQLVFCTKDVPIATVIEVLSRQQPSLTVTILPENSNFLISSKNVQELN
ncbi:hypothetical protein FACS1894201_04580 [Bacteroidia bacterium]|nr:hypothetical protein FACS1894201_04580 [Bacteroidia bacterium]